MDRLRRKAISALVAAPAVVGMGTRAANAQGAYPTRSLTFIVPQAAAGSTDTVARLTAQRLGQALGQQVVVENRPGAGGIIGADLVAKAQPNGYTLLVAGTGIVAINPFLYKNISYDPVRSFRPVALIAYSTDVLVVNPAVPVKTLEELVALARARPGEIKYASAGNGTSPHLTAELFQQVTQTRLMGVPYKGSTPAVVATVSGETSMMFTGIASSIGHIKSGRLRPISVSSAERSPSLPDVPTARESGLPQFEVNYWIGLLAPAGTPDDVIEILNSNVNKMLALPEVREKFASIGLEPVGGSVSGFAELIRKDLDVWGKTIAASNIKGDD